MVSELNKKIVLNKLREHGKLTSNHFFSLVKSGISKQTFYNTLSELEEDGKIIKEPFQKDGDARGFVAYSLPKIIKFEREQVKEVEIKYQIINEIVRSILHNEFELPKIGEVLNLTHYQTKIENQKQIDLPKRDYVISLLSELILQKSSLRLLLDEFPTRGEISTSVDRARTLDKILNSDIKKIKEQYKIKPREMYDGLMSDVVSNFQALGDFVDQYAKSDWGLRLIFNYERLFSNFKDKEGYDEANLFAVSFGKHTGKL